MDKKCISSTILPVWRQYGEMRSSMSWQRILETARRHGMPIVVTDIAGREPVVLLAFDEYERLLETAPTSVEKSVTGPTKIGRGETPGASHPRQNTEGAVVESIGASAEDEGMLMEERFYLEPIEDPQK